MVIPIVGLDLLRIQVNGRKQLLYEYLAAQLVSQLEIECETCASIDQLVAAYLNASRQNSRDEVQMKARDRKTKLMQFPSASTAKEISAPNRAP